MHSALLGSKEEVYWLYLPCSVFCPCWAEFQFPFGSALLLTQDAQFPVHNARVWYMWALHNGHHCLVDIHPPAGFPLPVLGWEFRSPILSAASKHVRQMC